MTLRFIQWLLCTALIFLPFPLVPFCKRLSLEIIWLTVLFLIEQWPPAIYTDTAMSESRMKSWISSTILKQNLPFFRISGQVEVSLSSWVIFIYLKQTLGVPFKIPFLGPFCGTYSIPAPYRVDIFVPYVLVPVKSLGLEYLVVCNFPRVKCAYLKTTRSLGAWYRKPCSFAIFDQNNENPPPRTDKKENHI